MRKDVWLTKPQMASILDETTAPDILLLLWQTIEPAFDDMETVPATGYAIPSEQWETICKRMIGRCDDRLEGTQAGLLMMNVGPSGY